MTGLNSDLTIGDREKAINCFMSVFRICKEDKFLIDWGETQNYLGTVYSELHPGF